jgi:hypothetical protein
MVFFYNSKNTLYLNRAKNLKAMLYMDHWSDDHFYVGVISHLVRKKVHVEQMYIV